MSRYGLIFTLLTCCIFWAGCNSHPTGVVAEMDEKHYQRGQRLLREGRPGEALSSFLKVIEKRPDAPESHLEAGILYQQHVGDPVASIYHLRRYIEMEPDTDEANRAKQLIETARKDFARSLPGQPYDSAIDRIDLLEMLEAAREENQELKRQLATVRQSQATQVAQATASQSNQQGSSRVSFSGSPQTSTPPPSRATETTRQASPPTPQPSRPANTTRQYTVVSGDTLTRISTKVYGDSVRWQDIFQANRDQLPNPDALKVGQNLKIPE